MPSQEFTWLDPGLLTDNDLELVLVQRMPEDIRKDWAPAYIFQMRNADTGTGMGSINLRIGTSENLVMYGGQIGYGRLQFLCHEANLAKPHTPPSLSIAG